MTDRADADASTFLALSIDEAIVLFELLSRWSDGKAGRAPSSECFESTAERAVLNDILAKLERQLVLPFSANWDEMLRGARERLEPLWDQDTQSG